MIQFFARVVELREEKTVIYDGKITVDLPSRGFLEVPYTKRADPVRSQPKKLLLIQAVFLSEKND